MAYKVMFNSQTQEVKIEAIGYQGQACLAGTKEIEEALGEVSDRTPKPEAMIAEPAAINQQIQFKQGTY